MGLVLRRVNIDEESCRVSTLSTSCIFRTATELLKTCGSEHLVVYTVNVWTVGLFFVDFHLSALVFIGVL